MRKRIRKLEAGYIAREIGGNDWSARAAPLALLVFNMEFGSRNKRRRGVEEDKEYPTRLQLYKIPPVQTISLQEFEELAIKRLKRKCREREASNRSRPTTPFPHSLLI